MYAAQTRTNASRAWETITTDTDPATAAWFLRDGMEREGFRHSELTAHCEDLVKGHILTSERGHEFRVVTLDPPAVRVEHKQGQWEITAVSGSLTDEQAAAITFIADPQQVVLGAFVAVNDEGGQRIGYVHRAELVRRAFAPSYVVASIQLH